MYYGGSSLCTTLDTSKSSRSRVSYPIHTLLSCRLWSAIDDMAPTIVFVHYTKLNNLQTTLSKLYCPPVNCTVRTNTNQQDDSRQYIIKTDNKHGDISLEDWLDAKADTLEFALKLSNGSCYYKTRAIDNRLEHDYCPMVQVLPRVW